MGSHCDNTRRLETHGHPEPGWGVGTGPTLASSRLFALPAAAGCGPGGGGRVEAQRTHDSFLGLLSLDSVKEQTGPGFRDVNGLLTKLGRGTSLGRCARLKRVNASLLQVA